MCAGVAALEVKVLKKRSKVKQEPEEDEPQPAAEEEDEDEEALADAVGSGEVSDEEHTMDGDLKHPDGDTAPAGPHSSGISRLYT